MSFYVYCVVDPIDSLPDETLKGLGQQEVSLLRLAELAVIVSEFSGDSVLTSEENVIAHQKVIRRLLEITTPLPFRFGTLVSESQLNSYLSSRQPALLRKLDDLRGCVEMSVKVIWPTSESKGIISSDNRQQGSGTAFLTAKKEELLGDATLAKKASDILAWLNSHLDSLLRDEQVSLRPRERMVLAAAHLLERERLTAYKEGLAAARVERPDLHFLVSGPWPPYSFANIDLEFKSQFGVS